MVKQKQTGLEVNSQKTESPYKSNLRGATAPKLTREMVEEFIDNVFEKDWRSVDPDEFKLATSLAMALAPTALFDPVDLEQMREEVMRRIREVQ